MGHCCLGEAAWAVGAPAGPTVLDLAIGIRPELVGRGWGVELGRAAVEYAKVSGGRPTYPNHRAGLEHRR